MKNPNLDILEEKLNIASTLMEELDIDEIGRAHV